MEIKTQTAITYISKIKKPLMLLNIKILNKIFIGKKDIAENMTVLVSRRANTPYSRGKIKII